MKQRPRRRLQQIPFEQLDDRLGLATVELAQLDIECCSAVGVNSVSVADIDGYLDVLIPSPSPPSYGSMGKGAGSI